MPQLGIDLLPYPCPFVFGTVVRPKLYANQYPSSTPDYAHEPLSAGIGFGSARTCRNPADP
jgi:hypothetical protein